VSLRFSPHVLGRFDSHGRPLTRANQQERRGKGGDMETDENHKQVSSASYTTLEISPRHARFPLLGWPAFLLRQLRTTLVFEEIHMDIRIIGIDLSKTVSI
jgi:hypothetical protein